MNYPAASSGVSTVTPADRLCRNGYISQFFTNPFKLIFPANAGSQHNINPLEDWTPACQVVVGYASGKHVAYGDDGCRKSLNF